jgi:hypothetical protein
VSSNYSYTSPRQVKYVQLALRARCRHVNVKGNLQMLPSYSSLDLLGMLVLMSLLLLLLSVGCISSSTIRRCSVGC